MYVSLMSLSRRIACPWSRSTTSSINARGGGGNQQSSRKYHKSRGTKKCVVARSCFCVVYLLPVLYINPCVYARPLLVVLPDRTRGTMLAINPCEAGSDQLLPLRLVSSHRAVRPPRLTRSPPTARTRSRPRLPPVSWRVYRP